VPRLKKIYLTNRNGQSVPITEKAAERIAENSLQHVVRRDKDGSIIEIRALSQRPKLFGDSQICTYKQTLTDCSTIALKRRDGTPTDKYIQHGWNAVRRMPAAKERRPLQPPILIPA